MIALLDKTAKPLGFNLYEDRFVATDSSYEWGDGTAPLLSATAGEYIRGETDRRNEERAKKYLGTDTEVEAVLLGPRHGHGALLNAPQIREKILAIYNQENSKSGAQHVFTDGGKEVESVKFVLQIQRNGKPSIVVIRLLEGDGAMTQQAAFVNGSTGTVVFEEPRIFDTNILAPKEMGVVRPPGVNRNLITTDLPGRSFSIFKRVGNEASRDLVINGISVFVNDTLYFEDKTTFALSSITPRVFEFPARQ